MVSATADSVPQGSPIRSAIRALVDGRGLDEAAAYRAARAIVDGEASPAQIAACLVALRMRGESIEEITGFTRALRERVEPVRAGDNLVDTCGTGGDGARSFNVSTVAAFVAAGAGCRVAKHGNRAVSSRSGSVEVLEALGVDAQVDAREAEERLERFGLAFLFAPRFQPAARHAALPRREIGVRSIFNIVGPLINPAGARHQLVGVFEPRLTEVVATVLGRFGARHCLVVHGEDGLDEITLTGPTRVSQLRDGAVTTWRLDPRELGFDLSTPEDITGGDPQDNARITLEVLAGRPGPRLDLVLLNAGAAIHVAGRAKSLREGIALARESIASGRAQRKLAELRGPVEP